MWSYLRFSVFRNVQNLINISQKLGDFDWKSFKMLMIFAIFLLHVKKKLKNTIKSMSYHFLQLPYIFISINLFRWFLVLLALFVNLSTLNIISPSRFRLMPMKTIFEIVSWCWRFDIFNFWQLWNDWATLPLILKVNRSVEDSPSEINNNGSNITAGDSRTLNSN